MDIPESLEFPKSPIPETNFAPTLDAQEALGSQEVERATAQILAIGGLVRQLGPEFTEEDMTDALGANFGLAA
jgi:hypothetical protein